MVLYVTNHGVLWHFLEDYFLLLLLLLLRLAFLLCKSYFTVASFKYYCERHHGLSVLKKLFALLMFEQCWTICSNRTSMVRCEQFRMLMLVLLPALVTSSPPPLHHSIYWTFWLNGWLMAVGAWVNMGIINVEFPPHLFPVRTISNHFFALLFPIRTLRACCVVYRRSGPRVAIPCNFF